MSAALRFYSALVAFYLTTAGGLVPHVTAQGSLESRFQNLIQEANAEAAFWGVYVQDAASGDVLLDINGRKPMIPASNQKLLTATAALEFLGPEYQYRTILYMDGEVDGSTFVGDLIIRGSGDPTFGSREFRGDDPLKVWAQRMADMGITAMRGRIIGDDNRFDDEPYAEGWDVDYIMNQPSRSLGVSTGGLSYADNTVNVRFASGRSGGQAEIRTSPSDYLTIHNRVTTSGRSRGISVTPRRVIGEEAVVFSGSIPSSYEGTVFMPVANPTLFAVHSLARFIEDRGIEIEAELIDVDDLDDRPAYDDLEPLFVHFSPPMAEILKVVNKESNNFFAEQVFRTVAPGGSASGAERRVKDLLRRADANADVVSVKDGSGLSRKDLVSPQALSQLLLYAGRQDYQPQLIESLPSGGEPNTTLRFRLRGSSAKAKTGSLEYVRALSGYTTSADGRLLTFVIFANHYTVPSYRIVQTFDRMVALLDSHTST